jgi:hypothetical protein
LADENGVDMIEYEVNKNWTYEQTEIPLNNKSSIILHKRVNIKDLDSSGSLEELMEKFDDSFK